MVPDGKSELVCTKMSSTEPNERNSYQQLLPAILKILASFRLSSGQCPDQSWKKPRFFSGILKVVGLLVFKGFLRFLKIIKVLYFVKRSCV